MDTLPITEATVRTIEENIAGSAGVGKGGSVPRYQSPRSSAPACDFLRMVAHRSLLECGGQNRFDGARAIDGELDDDVSFDPTLARLRRIALSLSILARIDRVQESTDPALAWGCTDARSEMPTSNVPIKRKIMCFA